MCPLKALTLLWGVSPYKPTTRRPQQQRAGKPQYFTGIGQSPAIEPEENILLMGTSKEKTVLRIGQGGWGFQSCHNQHCLFRHLRSVPVLSIQKPAWQRGMAWYCTWLNNGRLGNSSLTRVKFIRRYITYCSYLLNKSPPWPHRMLRQGLTKISKIKTLLWLKLIC